MSARRAARAAILLAAWLLWTPSPAAAQSETVEYYGLDALGSVRVVFDANGTIVTRMDYGPFGQELVGGTGLPDRRFAGLFRDGEAGLDHAGARSYQSRTGRFSTVDPIYAGLFEPQRWNRYSYALNNPVTFTDASGLQAWNGFCAWTMNRDELKGHLDCLSPEMQGFASGAGWGGFLPPGSVGSSTEWGPASVQAHPRGSAANREE